MLVRRSTYDDLQARHDILRLQYSSLLCQWNALIERINSKGGEQFIANARIRTAPQLSQEDIKRLLMLCHPDKHDGKPAAVEMTQKLLALREAQ